MALNRATCPNCSEAIMVASDRQGTKVHCSACGERLLLQRPQTGSPIATEPNSFSSAAAGAPSTTSSCSSPKKFLAGRPSGSLRTEPPPLPASPHPESSFSVLALASTIAALVAVLGILAVSVSFWPREDRRVETTEERGDQHFGSVDYPRPKSPKPLELSSVSKSTAMTGSKKRPHIERPQRSESSLETKLTLNSLERTPHAGDFVTDSLPAVAVVYGLRGHGSGFLAAPKILVTNYHVIRNSRINDLKVCFPDNTREAGRYFLADLLAEDPINDIAALRVDCDAQPLRIDPDYKHINGQRIVAIGSPANGIAGELRPNLSTPGRLGPPYKLPPNDVLYWALSTGVNGGNSGGPVIDEVTGKVVGMVVIKFLKTDSQALAVPHPKLLKFLRRAEQATDSDLKREQILHRARFCLLHMMRLRELTEFHFRESRKAAHETQKDIDAGWLSSFNQFKSQASSLLSDEFATFETIVCGEVITLQSDSQCDTSVRLALEKLRETTDDLVAQLRKPIQSGEVGAAVEGFRESLAHARSLADAAARSLDLEGDDE
jgi:S1-C subfamily serine protease